MATHHVQRTRTTPARFEWLRTDVTDAEIDAAEIDGSDLQWTHLPAQAHQFTSARAAEIAAQIAGASHVRFGDAEPEETIDFAAEAAVRAEAARQRRREGNGQGGGQGAAPDARPARVR